MTGHLERYLTRWNLTQPQHLTETATSRVYRVQREGAPAVLKVLTPTGRHDERHAPHVLRHFDGRGSVHLLAADAGAHLLEYVPGDSLESLAGTDDAAATRVIAGVLNQLHHNPQTESVQAWSLRRRFRALFERARLPGSAAVFGRAARLADTLLSDAQEVRVLHGDVHHGNILHKPGRGWLAIDPKGLIGERTFDTANTFYNPSGAIYAHTDRVRRTAEIFASETGLNRQRILQFACVYGCLSVAWGLDDGTPPESEWIQAHLQTVRLIEAFL
jgi:streptomycin 6-kinase